MDVTVEIKKRIHEFIDRADERILRIIDAIITTEEETLYEVPDSFYKEVQDRKENYVSGKSKSFTWEEVKEKVKSSVK